MRKTRRTLPKLFGYRTANAANAIGVLFLVCGSAAHAGKDIDDHQLMITPQLMIERSHQQQQAVSWAARYALNPEDRSLHGSGSTHGAWSVSTSDPIATSAPQWNFWLSGTYTHIKDELPLSGYESDQVSAFAGLDYQVTDNAIIGILFNGSRSENDHQSVVFPGNSEADTLGIGFYSGIALTDILVADVSWLYNWSDNFVADGFDTAAYDSQGWTAAANLTAYFYNGNWRISPAVGINYSENDDEAYVDSAGTAIPAQHDRTGVASVSSQAGYTFETGDMKAVEVWAGIAGEWTYERSGSPTLRLASIPVRESDFDVRASAGLDMQVTDSFNLSLSGEVAGLALSDYLSVSGTGRASLRF